MLASMLEVERSQLDTKKLVVQKGESIQRNLLRIDRDTVVVGERCQEDAHLGCTHLSRMSALVKQDESLDPVQVGFSVRIL